MGQPAGGGYLSRNQRAVIWNAPITLTNAHVVTEQGTARSVRFASHVLAIGGSPAPGDAVVDARGSFVLPGLVNAHDHLELNHYGRLKFRERYCNAGEWIGDMRPRLADNAAIRDARSQPLGERLFIGALKNLLSGVTTVVHHNPFYPELRRDMPLRVLKEYGWAHSFLLQYRPAGARGECGGDVRSRYRSTPRSAPFFVHLAEGVDADARAELDRLESLGCLAPNTVLVHAVGIDGDGWRRVASVRAGTVWCPASNIFLFGQTLDPTRTESDVALGTDSRLTGSRDLLEELRVAHEASKVQPARLLSMVTSGAAAMIRQPQLGRIAVGAPADLLIVPRVKANPAETLLATARRDIELVTVGGRPMFAHRALAGIFSSCRTEPRMILVDETPKIADGALARRIAECPIVEPGVAVA